MSVGRISTAGGRIEDALGVRVEGRPTTTGRPHGSPAVSSLSVRYGIEIGENPEASPIRECPERGERERRLEAGDAFRCGAGRSKNTRIRRQAVCFSTARPAASADGPARASRVGQPRVATRRDRPAGGGQISKRTTGRGTVSPEATIAETRHRSDSVSFSVSDQCEGHFHSVAAFEVSLVERVNPMLIYRNRIRRCC